MTQPTTKPTKNYLQTVLTFVIAFLLINYAFNFFFPSKKIDPTAQGKIILITDKTEFGLREVVGANIQNNTQNDIVLKNNCPSEPLQVAELTNSNWAPKTYTAQIKCEGTSDIIIKPGEKYHFIFNNWNNALFENLGTYKLSANIGDKTIESNQFQVTPQGWFSYIWNLLFYQPIYNILILIISILPGNDLGFGIIILTIIIRTILLVPSQRALKSQKKIQKLQPHIDRLKDVHGDDKQKISLATMALYKEHKVSPFSSCLPLLIQLPVLIALFNVVQNGLNPDNSYLLYSFLQNFDLSKIQTNFLGILDLTKTNFIVLPIIVGLLQFLQMKLSLSKNKNSLSKVMPEMQAANNMMIYMMPIMIAVFTASTPAGVGIYWCFSTLYGVLQQVVVNYQSDNEGTKIQEVKSAKNKEKKELYKQKAEKRKASKTSSTTPEKIADEDEDDDNENHDENKIIKIKI